MERVPFRRNGRRPLFEFALAESYLLSLQQKKYSLAHAARKKEKRDVVEDTERCLKRQILSSPAITSEASGQRLVLFSLGGNRFTTGTRYVFKGTKAGAAFFFYEYVIPECPKGA